MRKEKKLKEKGKGKKKVVQKAKQKEKEKKKLQKVRVQKAKRVELITASAGSYPRIGDTEELQKLRRAWAKRETGEISEEEFRNVQKEFIELAIREQEKAGLDIVTDGLITWYDQISHFAKNIQGVKI
ncbi:MAG: hypothetical protein ACO2PO_05665, partial [Candidatus Calescibacterium sp.]